MLALIQDYHTSGFPRTCTLFSAPVQALFRNMAFVQVFPPSWPFYAGADVLPRSSCSLHIPNLCDNFVKKLVSEIRKCCQLQGDFVHLTPLTRGFDPGPQCGLRPTLPSIWSPFPEALDPLVRAAMSIKFLWLYFLSPLKLTKFSYFRD